MFAFCFSFVAFTLLAGCQGRSSSKTGSSKGVEIETEVDLASRLQKPTDLLSAAKEVIQAIESSGAKSVAEPLSPTEIEELKQSLHLNPMELAEISRVSFTASGLDTPYLAECLLLRDAMTSLGMSRLPPLRQSELALEWVGRQMVLQDQAILIAPVWYALQRGGGNHFERAFVFLAALQQLGFDAGLIGSRDLKQPHTILQEAPNRFRFAPFWAVGVRIDDRVYLFNPLTAKPFPGPDGKGVATLDQLVGDPKLSESWIAAKIPVSAPSNDLKEPKLYLTPRLSSLAPRMKTLEDRLKTNGVKLALNWTGLKERLGKALNASKVEVVAWNPPEDAFTPTHGLAYFLPADAGGFQKRDKNDVSNYEIYMANTLRLNLLKLDLQELSDARSMIVSNFRRMVSSLFLFGPNLPRERLVRGRLDDAIEMLTLAKDQIDSAKIRVEQDPQVDGEFAKWSQELDLILGRLRRAQRTNNQEELDRAAKEQAEFGRDTKKMRILESFVIRATSRVQSAESVYLIALAVHEEAERYQLRFETEKLPELAKLAQESWINTREWWNRYLQNYPELAEIQRERNQHARNLLKRAESLITPTVPSVPSKEKK